MRGWTDEELQSWDRALKRNSVSTGIKIFDDKPKTNADRIRSMTDDELVKIITEWTCPNNWSRASCHKHYELEKGCSSCWLEWLKGEWKE